MLNVPQNRLPTIAFRGSIALFALWVFAHGAQAQPARNPQPEGVYNGSFTGDKGPTKFKLTITRKNDNGYEIGGVLTLYLPEGSGTNVYTCDLDGNYISRGGGVELRRTKWETAAPNIDMLGLNASFNSRGGNGAGQISGIIGGAHAFKFEAIRDTDESAKMADAGAKPAEPPAGTPVAPPVGRTAATDRRAAPPSSPAPDTAGPTAINGVYAGTYGSNPDDTVPAKLYIKFVADGSALGTLDGLLTFDVPPSPGAKPITYTYKLIGRPEPGAGHSFLFFSAKPLGKPAPDAYAVNGLNGGFAKSLVNGQWSFDPDQISASALGSNNRPTANKFEARRDKDESAKLDGVMAAQSRATGAVVSTAAPHAAQTAPPSIEGVFNGTYTRKNEPPAKFKLTMTHAPYAGGVTGVKGLAGVATIYLLTDSGTKAYTFSLKGIEEGEGHFFLHVYDWETIPPKHFEHFEAMGFDGTFLPNVTQHRARIVSVPAPDVEFVPKFEATWDPTESADIKGTIAAQKAVRDADQVAALKARAELIKNAPPKQLASKGLVRKSQAYWKAYHGDSVRQIFDGGFADDVNDDPSFQVNFVRYVDLFSKNCSANLPANHHPITIVTTTYRNGQVVKTEPKTVDIDPRFIKKYCEFSGVEPTPGSAEASDLAARDAHIFRRIMQAGTPAGRESNGDAIVRFRLGLAHAADDGRDLDRFFATETGSSAAMRQLTENFLRAATGEPSLQEAGAKIDGAEAETDKDLPPGRFTHLIDAANAFYRDPANASLRSKYDTTLYMLLAERYRGVMTPEEEYYYANDFAGRFQDGIQGERSTDPAWPRLHPVVLECMKELGR